MPTHSKNLFIDAMNDWKSKVPSLQFIDVDTGNTLLKLRYKLMFSQGLIGIVTLGSMSSVGSIDASKDDTFVNIAGLAHVGEYKGQSAVCLIKDGLSGVQAINVPRHELGHTLGLEHEHQRWDRDTYLKYDPGTLAAIIPTMATSLGSYYPIDVQGVTVYVYKFAPLNANYSIIAGKDGGGTVDFDYLSIMIYSTSQVKNLKAKVAQQGITVDGRIPYNTVISAGDIATVKLMYGQ